MKHILLVDDEYALVETLKDFLEEAGYRVETADNGQAALALMKASRPDLVVSDLMMPLMSGKELLIAMRADGDLAAVPVILMSSGRRQVVLSQDAEGLPEFSDFLRKPFDLTRFMSTVRKVLGPD